MPRPNMNANYGKAKDTKETLIKLSKYIIKKSYIKPFLAM